MYKLAIVIPFYKIDHFEETLESLRIQTNQDFSLYIGNDASPDNPLPILQKYFEPKDYNYFHYQDNLGCKNLALQWERILENVKEEWFQILGDDDFVSFNFVEQLYKNINAIDSSINVIKVKNVLCDGNNTVTNKLYESFKTGMYSAVDLMIKKIGGGLNSSLSEHVFRLAKYKTIGFPHYELAWHTDDMYILKASDFKKVFFIAETQVFVRVYEGSTSGSKNNLQNKNRASILFFNDLSDIFKEKNISWTKRRQYLKSLRNNKEAIGHENIRRIYFKNGIKGKMYYGIYLLKLIVKSFFPKTILHKIQK